MISADKSGRKTLVVALAVVAALVAWPRGGGAALQSHSGYSSMGSAPIESDVPSRVNVNTASVDDLAGISGIGVRRAMAIVEYRDQNGPFRSVEDLLYVPGIGALELSGFRDRLTVE